MDGREWRRTFRGSLRCTSGALRRVRGQPGSATSWLRNAAGSDSSQHSAALPSSIPKISIQVVVTARPEVGYPMKSPRWVPRFLSLMIPLAIDIAQVTSMGSFALPVMFALGILGHRMTQEGTHTEVVDATVPVSLPEPSQQVYPAG